MDQDEAKDYFLQIYDTYADAIFRFALVKVSDRDLAADLSQEVFMRFWQALRAGTTLRNDRALLYTIARNLIIDWYRKKKDQSLDTLRDAGFDPEGGDEVPILEHAQTQEILKALHVLDEASREAVLLRYVEGFTPAEIGALRDETANAISVRISRALAKVRTHLHTYDS